MKLIKQVGFILILYLFFSCRESTEPVRPLSLHPQNPHYFLFHGRPAILIGSTEHYGAVLNLDFDYVTYLDQLASSGLNITRTFSGIYVEPQGAFGIRKNTLAPANGRFIAPWARSNEEGYANGGNKFDLTKWDENYFFILKDFLKEAGERNIVVELDLFSNFYDTVQWKLSPLYFRNNINGIGNIKDHKEILSMKHPEIIDIQEKMVRKIINELKEFENLYYEVCNEPYFGDTLALREWEDHMTAIVMDAEKDFTYKHLISNNIANHKKLVPEPRNGVSIYNFHYARPPVTVPMNYHLNMALGDNETGFSGIGDAVYRIEAWDFILSGGALFNHLDYSFTTDNEDGSYIIGEGQPGGGGQTIRDQLRILVDFMQYLNYIDMEPIDISLAKVSDETNTNIYGLVEESKVFALHLSRKDTADKGSNIEINLPAGSYEITWVDTKSGNKTNSEITDHPGGWAIIETPEYKEDIALKIRRTNNITDDTDISIHEAALNGQTVQVVNGLEKGIDVNKRDAEGRTALMYASYNGHTEIVKVLIEKGAMVNMADSYGRTALMMASSGPFAATVKVLLDNQTDPNMADYEEHFTALMYAAAEGQTDVVRILLSYGADPDLKDVDGDNALTFAVNNNHKEVASLLQSINK
jgi:hypothetical protein